MLEPHPEPIPDEELAAIIAGAILDGKSGRMTRDAEGYLAGVCAEYLVDQLALAGVVAVRNAPWIGGGADGTDASTLRAACRDVRAAGVHEMDDDLSNRRNRDR